MEKADKKDGASKAWQTWYAFSFNSQPKEPKRPFPGVRLDQEGVFECPCCKQAVKAEYAKDLWDQYERDCAKFDKLDEAFEKEKKRLWEEYERVSDG